MGKKSAQRNPTASPEVEEVSEPVLDVSNLSFTVSRCCMLGETAVVEDTDFVVLKELPYRSLEVLATRKITKRAEELGVEFTWSCGHATISANRVPMREHLKMSVEDENGWKKVEQGVERWMKEKKTQIVVKLVTVYNITKVSNAESLSKEANGSKKVRTF